MNSFTTLSYEVDGGIAHLMLDRPERLNALGKIALVEINAAMDLAEEDPSVKAIIISGKGKAFSSGFDLKEQMASRPEGAAAWREILARDFSTTMRFWDCPKPTIAAVHGSCLAGAFEIALACDITIASEDATFGEPELKFGAGIVTMLLPWMIGPKQAKEIILCGIDDIPAEEARRLGIVNRVVPIGKHLEEAIKVARTIAVIDPNLMKSTKAAINLSVEAMGMKGALQQALDIDHAIESKGSPDKRAFMDIAREGGLKAALAWRDQRFHDPQNSLLRSSSPVDSLGTANETFQAMVLRKDSEGFTANLEQLAFSDLPDEDTLVQLEYSTLNYKDALAITGSGPIVKTWPLVPGIDFAGTVVETSHPRLKPGQRVVLTGWGVGEKHWGGHSQYQRVKGDWLVPLPDNLSTKQAMMFGTAGLTAMLCVNALRDAGVKPESGPILVTGAAGGVGSVAIAILTHLGYSATALINTPEKNDYVRSLGAVEVIDNANWADERKALESQCWAGAIDAIGSGVLARVLSQMNYGGVVAACGLAGGSDLPTSVMPFILRGVRLIGIDSVSINYETRLKAWADAVESMPTQLLNMISAKVVPLQNLKTSAEEMLAGKLAGRIVIDVNARSNVSQETTRSQRSILAAVKG
ncbi:acryloyl-CoA reductase [Pseudomonas rhodesiae]|uniref:acrylyl-CoA reductase family protein n=1 Tax=Pseudomonas rhodesiae TaxID=76760 RepID=UPI001BCFB689|nr:acryloyl-CoA reductase [Pseudomonas rhodesiae]QVN04042.1 acryloyl-CoA reductase [Pseudomonas rhodesiae]